MKIKGRTIINTSLYSFIRTAHETNLIFQFDFIMFVLFIMYLDLLRFLNSDGKLTLQNITDIHIELFKSRMAGGQNRCQ